MMRQAGDLFSENNIRSIRLMAPVITASSAIRFRFLVKHA